ncbi:MAG: hypothetical protein PHT02_11755 [Tissierellia bacterium]|nr:hypothetical protein [Tissierellia bacterium]
MKPSEYLKKMYLDNSFLDDVDNDSDNISLIKKQLDKRFIDKEKLIHSLNLKIMTYHLQSEEYELNRIDKLNILKMKIKEEVINEILELLEE